MNPDHSLSGSGYRERQSGSIEPIEEVQIFFYPDGQISGSFVCRTRESNGILWLFDNGFVVAGTIYFDMVHLQLRFPREPVATFIGEYDGEGTYTGKWESATERGRWQLSFRDIVKSDSPGPHWYT